MKIEVHIYKKDTAELGFIIDYLYNAIQCLDNSNPGERPLRRNLLKARRNLIDLKNKLTKTAPATPEANVSQGPCGHLIRNGECIYCRMPDPKQAR